MPASISSQSDVANLDTLTPTTQERTHPLDDGTWQTELHQLGYQDVVVDMVERLGKVNVEL